MHLAAQLVAVYEAPGPEDGAAVMGLMQELQACGQPPQEILRELAPGLEFGPDGAPVFGAPGEPPPGLPPQCAQQ